jgi:hypothetical protein
MSDHKSNLNPDSQMPDDETLDRLIYMYLEGTLNPQDAVILMGYLKDSRCVKYFVERCKQEQVLYELISSNIQQQADASCSFESDVWKELARHEEHAPAIPLEKIVEPTPVENLSPAKVRRINKTSLITAIVSIAALTFMIAYVNLFSGISKESVATIIDAIDAQWENSTNPGVGEQLFTRDGLLSLRQGIVKIQFNNGTQVILEAPGKFELVAPDQINLHYGKLFARVPKSAIGFTVKTQTTKVIDLGTEFGVDAISDGGTELHVYKGKTTLIAGSGQNDKELVEVTAGNAKKVRYADSQIRDITLKELLFVREIDSSKQFIWKGQPLNLASMVSGGDGFTKGEIKSAIDPATGQINPEAVQKYGRSGRGGFKSVPDRAFIDGVFVPDGDSSADVVSSAGHTFAFPKTDNYYFSDITSNPYIWMLDPGRKQIHLSLGQTEVENASATSLILVHSNAGITFDLDKIRRSIPQLEVDRFKAVCGVSKVREGDNYQSEFWVLIDGTCVFHYRSEKGDHRVRSIDIPIKPDQKFLTLATTCGDDSISMDWCIFDNPQLVLAKKQQDVNKTDRETNVEK